MSEGILARQFAEEPSAKADQLDCEAARPGNARIVAAAAIGNFLEFYDFILFGFFASTLATLYFPAGNPSTSLLLTLATFGVASFTRPLGALVIGAYCDRAGRKAGLTATILMMAVSTALIGLLPTYGKVGVLAPVLLVVARLFQGFAAGGEFGGATAFLTEHAPARSRDCYGGWLQTGIFSAAIAAGLMGFTVSHGLSREAALAWGWRVPFLLGILLAPIGVYIRNRVPESPLFRRTEGTAAAAPLRAVVSSELRSTLTMIGAVLPSTVGSYLILLYIPTFAIRQLGLPEGDGFAAAILGSAVAAVLAPVAGAASDRLGRKAVMLCATLATVVLAWPLFAWMVSSPSLGVLLVAEAMLAVLLAGFAGPMMALGAELFPTHTRSTGLSVGYGLSAAVFGNFTPLIIASVIAATGQLAAPSFYLAAAALVGSVAIALAPERRGVSLAAVADTLP